MLNYLGWVGAMFGLAAFGIGQASQTPTQGQVTLDLQHPGHPISPNFFGLMTEEINHSYDGGLYAELIRNRSFRDANDSPVYWTATGPSAKLTLEGGAIPSVRLDPGDAAAELSNPGYWGIPVRPHTTYKVTLRAKGEYGFAQPVKLSLRSNDGSQTFAEVTLSKVSNDWKVYHATLRTSNISESLSNKFVISTSGPGALDLNYVSVFPPTFHNRPNGNRIDLMENISQLRPSFLRLPGGNYLEGDTVATRFEWKDTLGNPIDRTGHQGPWGYRSSDGLGLLEFLEWCEDLKMSPLLAVYAGYSLRGDHIEPGSNLNPFVQDALDEIEYVTGTANSTWGAKRAKDGHPNPFPLTYVEIGNEDWFDRSRTYDARFAQFYDAIKSKYPQLQIISTAPVSSRTPDVIDDHFYRLARDMAADSGHYDATPRTGPKIFVGEWASVEGAPTPNMQAALGDAAWLTGLERDSDVVVMESYAPLLVNVNKGASQWGTNLIGYDALRSFASPSFWVQSMYAAYTGDVVIPIQSQVNLPAPPPRVPSGRVGLGTWHTEAEFKDAEVTHDGQTLYKSDLSSSDGWSPVRGTWAVKDGAYGQSSDEEGTLSFAGDSDWKDYTYQVKARKLGGDEGFIIPFHVKDHDDFYQWNIGGWGNTRTRFQRVEGGTTDEIGSRSNATVESGRWYDIKIEVEGVHIRGYLDGKLISQATEAPRSQPNPIYLAASKNSRTGHLFLKIVNFSDSSIPLQIQGINASDLKSTAVTGLVLSGARSEVNTVDNPDLLRPKPISFTLNGQFNRSFPPRSVTVLDVPLRNSWVAR